jgi:membrane protein DedA with SNARE-associated domain
MAVRLIGEGDLTAFHRFFDRHGVMAIVVTRPLPIVMETMSLVAGLSRMTRAAFLAASVAGTAPIVFVYAYAGALSREVGSLVPAAVMLMTVMGAGWLWYRSRLTAASRA